MTEDVRDQTFAPPVPLVDLKSQHAEVADAVACGFARVLEETCFVGGRDVKEFERAYSRFTGAAHCVGVANGTDALELGLRALGVGPGDEVVVPANTFIASAEAVARTGAAPVFVDVDDRYLLMSPEALVDVLSPRVRAVMPVHLFGQAAPVEQLRDVLGGRDVAIVEDAAQSQGATRFGAGAGTLGDVAGTSFYPGKNLGAYGDAGAVLTGDEALAGRVRALAAHGSTMKYEHPVLGFNSRLDTLQAVVLSAKLKRLAAWNAQRVTAAEGYAALLEDVPEVRLPEVLPGNEHVWHLYVVRVQRRDDVLAHLHAAGIGAGVHYPVPVHLTGAFARTAGVPAPVAEIAARQILSLPMFPGITADQQERVVTVLTDAVRRR
jgi:dTDP-4-amino-4,6-dideoxygalactose transaminase